MKRIALFAHYDRDGIIDDYVIYYLRGLSRVADKIVFVSDSELRRGEAAKLNGLADLAFAGRHAEYDFGSWKRGLQSLNFDLAEWDELILANDSCYAPIYSFEDAFDRMDQVNCDFWGATANNIGGKFDHISSYFMVFRRPILADDDFLSFWMQIEPQPDVGAIVEKYECGLSRLLTARWYRYASLTPAAEVGSFATTRYVHKTLHDYRSCWLKVRLVRDNPIRAARLGEALDNLREIYPKRLVNCHLERMLGTSEPRHHFYAIGGKWRFKRGGVEVSCHLKKGKPHKQEHRRFDWMKIYVYVVGIPVFALAWPVKRAVSDVRRKPASLFKTQDAPYLFAENKIWGAP